MAGIANLRPTIERATVALVDETFAPGVEIPEAISTRAELVTTLTALFDLGIGAMRQAAARHFAGRVAPPGAPQPFDH